MLLGSLVGVDERVARVDSVPLWCLEYHSRYVIVQPQRDQMYFGPKDECTCAAWLCKVTP